MSDDKSEDARRFPPKNIADPAAKSISVDSSDDTTSVPEAVIPEHGDVDAGEAVVPVTEDESSANQPQHGFTTLKPATWRIEQPQESWCPNGLESELGFEPHYEHESKHSRDIGNHWRMASASKRGRMHAHNGTFREDALGFSVKDNFSFYCVCDGAGSSKLSRIGSEYTVQILCKLVQAELLAHENDIVKCSQESLPVNLRAILHLCLDTVARRLVALAEKAEMEPRDFRCTVLTVLHYRHPTGGIFLFGNVGDGFTAVKRKGFPAERVGTSDSGAFSGEVTCFMPDPQVTEFYRTSLEGNAPIPEDEVEAYMLCTDGVEDPFFPVHRTVDEIYNQITHGFQSSIKDVTYPEGSEPSSVIRAACPGEELLKWLSFEKRGENDDRTIIFVYRNDHDHDGLLEEDGAALEDEPKEGNLHDSSGFPPPHLKSTLHMLLIMSSQVRRVIWFLVIGFIIGYYLRKLFPNFQSAW
jgi:serine/threonine protein phosphatase PrpC